MDRHLRIGVVQMDCRVGDIRGNLAHAGELVETTLQQGAQIVLLPELMPSGYTLTEEIWDYAEPFSGPTVAWLTHTAKRLNIYLGTSFLEADGEDFFNTFALASPHGTIAGTVRKSPPASLEAFFYRAGEGSHVIETEIGRVGVGICYENLLFARLYGLFQASVDLVLQPTAAGRPKPMKPGLVCLYLAGDPASGRTGLSEQRSPERTSEASISRTVTERPRLATRGHRWSCFLR
jgi:N-carbamoylputrescine amidase